VSHKPDSAPSTLPLTDAQIEAFAIRAAKGNNGGEWATHYAEEHKDFWRSFVRDLAADIMGAANEPPL